MTRALPTILILACLALTAPAADERRPAGREAAALPILEEGPRNPFWPQGYEGTRYPISVQPRIKPQEENEEDAASEKAAENKSLRRQRASAAAEAARKAEAEAKKAAELKWTAARKSLKFGTTFGFQVNGAFRSSVMINGRVYGVGDLISTNFGDTRFTWMIKSLSADGKIKLQRIKSAALKTEPKK